MKEILQKLQALSLVAKLATEIANYTQVTDKNLAEYILHLHDESVKNNPESNGKAVADFQTRLNEAGAMFPDSFIDHMDSMIRIMDPKHKPQQSVKTEPKRPQTERDSVFKALSIPDTGPVQFDEDKPPRDVESDRNSSDRYRSDRSDNRSDGYKSERYDRDDRRERHRENRRNADRYDYDDHRDHRGRGHAEYDSASSRSRRRSPSVDEYGRVRGRRRSRSRSASPKREAQVRDKPQVGDLCDVRVANITTFGAFATLLGYRHKVDGLIHISEMREGSRVEHPGQVVSRGDIVQARILKIENGKISLSMKAANPEPEKASGLFKSKSKRRLTSPERWEIRQLIASGAATIADYPELLEENPANDDSENARQAEEDVDIEVREDEPAFLAGQTHQSLDLSPIRVVKAPDGSMNRAAISGSSLAKERRETRQQEQREKEAQEKAASKAGNGRVSRDPLASAAATGPNGVSIGQPTSTQMSTWKEANSGRNVSYGKRVTMTIDEQRRSLPVYKLREQLLQAIDDNQILIVVGDTGSGKTTQITQYLVEEGLASRDKKIACTQPRRVAAVSVAKRVSEEMGCKVGEEVGYTIRFEDCTSDRTIVKYMTEGMLEREALFDPDMKQYSVIMLDEAHERTIATDVLFALLKKAARRRPDLKLIITSATLDAEKFSEYFFQCPILFIPGRTYPVDILYTKEPEFDYLEASLMTILQIHLSEPPGDILVFLTGQEEIDTSCEMLHERMQALGPDVPELVILPVYSALPSEMQSRIFDPAPRGGRKVVIGTNIAETSITIDGIYYVVDPGFVKVNAYDPKIGMDSLVISPISQAQAKQRAGRAGRTGPGKCYRLYTESAFQNEMLPNTIPEIQRQNLSNTILMLKAMGINDLLHFDFMDPPPSNTMLTALEQLYQLAALDSEGLLTRLGRKMADFPMEPALSKVLISSVDAGCSEEILTIVAMLSMQSIFYRPREKKEQADQKKSKFHDPSGDHLTLLNVYNAWLRSGRTRGWCVDNFIQERTMRRADDVRRQLASIMKRYRHELRSCGDNSELIRKVLCSGYFRNSARKDPQEGYKTLAQATPVFMHPASALFGKHAEYVIYHTLLLTSKEYMNCVSVIDPKWLVETAPTFFKVAGSDSKLSKRKQQEKILPLFNRYASDPDEWRVSAQKRLVKPESHTFG